MNKRTVAIIDDLINAKQDISIVMLAEKYEVSQRTIRNDINAINEVLSENQLDLLELQSGGVIKEAESFVNVLAYDCVRQSAGRSRGSAEGAAERSAFIF